MVAVTTRNLEGVETDGWALDGVKQITELANPKTMKRLLSAGMITPKTPLGRSATSFPWLIGRGPTLGMILKMNATAVGDKDAIRDRKGSITWSETGRTFEQGRSRSRRRRRGAGRQGWPPDP